MRANPLVAIIGCTGTGKTKFAVELAHALKGEIINGDVMQVLLCARFQKKASFLF